jgi:hypothetical protein
VPNPKSKNWRFTLKKTTLRQHRLQPKAGQIRYYPAFCVYLKILKIQAGQAFYEVVSGPPMAYTNPVEMVQNQTLAVVKSNKKTLFSNYEPIRSFLERH